MVLRALDILNGATLGPVVSGAGVVVPAPAPFSPAADSPPMDRFQTIASNMQNTARESIAQEIERIIALPIIPQPTEEQIRAVSLYYCPDGEIQLYPEQVNAMMQYHEYGGLLCPIPVGGGKTLVSVLIPNDAYNFFGKRKILLMVPPDLINQLRDVELPWYRRHISINIPFYWLAGQTAGKRMLLANSGRAGCYVVSYSILSGRQGSELLDAIKPELIVGDEIHSIASANPSARGRRFRIAIKMFGPQLVGLSGTITKKSPRDYHHLAVHTLHENCFMPRPTGIADEWAKIIDCNASSIDEFHNNAAPQPGPIKPLIEWAKKYFPDQIFPNNLIGFRSAFNIRKDTCPGVIASNGDQLGVSLRITNIDGSQQHRYSSTLDNTKSNGWKELREIVKQLVTMWVAPNGDEIDHAMHLWRWRYELEGFGFYNNLYWPEAERVAARKKLPLAEAKNILERSQAHHMLHQEYMKDLRYWIKHRAKKGMDTPFLIAGDMFHHGSDHVGPTLYKSWKTMKDAEFEGMVERDKAVVRVCDFRVKKVVEWAQKWYKDRPNKAAIIWVKNKGVAEWLREVFLEADLPMVYCPAGKMGQQNIDDRAQGNKFAIASISAHHKGRNLQYHHDAEFFAQWPREAHIAEQSLGRVHRNGQEADECQIFQSIESDFDRVLFASCINDAAYIDQTSQRQKLLYADYAEAPKILPYSVLMAWGTQATQLDAKGKRMLEDRFKGDVK